MSHVCIAKDVCESSLREVVGGDNVGQADLAIVTSLFGVVPVCIEKKKSLHAEALTSIIGVVAILKKNSATSSATRGR